MLWSTFMSVRQVLSQASRWASVHTFTLIHLLNTSKLRCTITKSLKPTPEIFLDWTLENRMARWTTVNMERSEDSTFDHPVSDSSQEEGLWLGCCSVDMKQSHIPFNRRKVQKPTSSTWASNRNWSSWILLFYSFVASLPAGGSSWFVQYPSRVQCYFIQLYNFYKYRES